MRVVPRVQHGYAPLAATLDGRVVDRAPRRIGRVGTHAVREQHLQARLAVARGRYVRRRAQALG